MKYLTIFAVITVIALCGETVIEKGQSTLDQIKSKARQIHKKFDTNSDGEVTYDEVSQGVKDKLGLGESLEDKSYTRYLYEKFISGKKSGKYTEEDFEELFRGHYNTKGKQQQSQEEESTLQMIKEKASQIYKKFDKNQDHQVTFQQFTSGFKEKLGFELDQERQASLEKNDEKSFLDSAKELYEKYVKSDKQNKQYFTEQDFSEILKQSRKNKRSKDQKDQQSFIGKLKDKANDLYDRFDTNKDNEVSFEQLGQGLKTGLGFDSEQDSKKQNSKKKQGKTLNEYANQLYERYVKPDQKESKHFSRQDFYEIVRANRKESILDKAKNKATEMHASLDTNKDGEVTMEELVAGLQSGLGFDVQQDGDKKAIKKDDKTYSEYAQQLYDKYVKSDKKQLKKGFAAEDFSDIVFRKMGEAKYFVTQKASEAKQGLSDLADSAIETGKDVVDGISGKASQIKDSISGSAQQLVQQAKDKIDQASDKASEVKKTVSKKASQAKQGLSDLADSAIETGKDVVDGIADKASEVKKTVSKKASQAKQGIQTASEEIVAESKQKAAKASKQASKLKQSVKDKAQQIVSQGKQKANTLKNAAQKKAKQTKQQVQQKLKDRQSDSDDESLIEKLKQKASQIYKKIDSNKDERVSIEELKAGIKAGLGFSDEQKSLKDDESISKYISDVYDKYIKGEDKNKKWLSKEDFYGIFEAKSKLNRKDDCKKSNKLSLEQLKTRAYQIHDKFDENKDGHVSVDQASKAIKEKLGFQNQQEQDEKSLFQYLKGLYNKYIGSGEKDLKLSKDDFTDIVYEWKKQCPANKEEQDVHSSEL